MTLNVIDNKMKAQTKIELQPTINYVSASSDCNFFDRLDIDSAGVIGDVKHSNIVFGDNSHTFDINNTRFNNFTINNNVLEKITLIKDNVENAANSVNEQWNGIDTSSYDNYDLFRFTASRGVSLLEHQKKSYFDGGVQKSSDSNFSFGIDRIKTEFLIDSPSFRKKQTVLNLHSFYRENMKYNNFHDLGWGFKNYNSINFFNIDEKVNANFSDNVTHKNCIIYPNIIRSNDNSNRQTYNLKDISDFSIAFYINPRRKSKTGFHYNPGCIINIPGVISVFVVKGSSFDENGLTDMFRLFCQFGNETYNNVNETFNNESVDINNPLSQNSSTCYLSKDNILSFNNWHNVVLSLKKTVIGSDNKHDLVLYVDGKNLDEVSDLDEISEFIGNSFITIGNKYNISEADINDFTAYSFSRDLDAQNDSNGPYVNKHILFGTQVNSVLNSRYNSSNTYSLNNSLNASNSGYLSASTSMALNAEICDIRIYRQFIDEIKVKDVSSNAIVSLDEEKNNFDLIFYLPAYYVSQKVRKKGLVNLSAPYQVYVSIKSGGIADFSVLGTIGESLSGPYLNQNSEEINEETIPHATDFRVDVENISYNYPINPIYYTFTGGTDVSVEHFLREFVFETQPNVVIGDSVIEDRYQDCFLFEPSKIVSGKSLNNITKQGGTPDDILLDLYKSITSDTINNITHIDHQSNNILYRNYMILPNDNGLQRQYYSEDVFAYENDVLKEIHKDDFGSLDYSFINLKKIDTSFVRRRDINLASLIENEVSFDQSSYDIDNEFYRNLENDGFIQFNLSFERSRDKIKNISLSNFHSDTNTLYVNDFDVDNIVKISAHNQEYIVASDSYSRDELFLERSNSFYKTLSNPSQRSYYANHDNAISNSEIYDNKPLDSQNNIAYKKLTAPLWNTDPNNYENCSTIFAASTQLIRKKIKRETLTLKDVDLICSSGLNLTFKDSKLGTMYRSDCLTEVAKWNTSGNVLYNEGIVSLRHPSLFSFGKTNLTFNALCHASLNVFELNLPAHAGETNETKNTSKIDNLRLDDSAFNSDEDFVYITDIDLHDENLNVVASVKLAQPFAKKDSDNVLFRVKMDY